MNRSLAPGWPAPGDQLASGCVVGGWGGGGPPAPLAAPHRPNHRAGLLEQSLLRSPECRVATAGGAVRSKHRNALTTSMSAAGTDGQRRPDTLGSASCRCDALSGRLWLLSCVFHDTAWCFIDAISSVLPGQNETAGCARWTYPVRARNHDRKSLNFTGLETS